MRLFFCVRVWNKGSIIIKPSDLCVNLSKKWKWQIIKTSKVSYVETTKIELKQYKCMCRHTLRADCKPKIRSTLPHSFKFLLINLMPEYLYTFYTQLFPSPVKYSVPFQTKLLIFSLFRFLQIRSLLWMNEKYVHRINILPD